MTAIEPKRERHARRMEEGHPGGGFVTALPGAPRGSVRNCSDDSASMLRTVGFTSVDVLTVSTA